ncbi:tRNA pseudouridine(55) synthase TruB [Lolliginicoccus levis]|uniref:tRNA pseudouridine(55) synthase TruB n=1 Tax=Lolliginicoccus levis TaxID=2919542 RepID=UPI00241FC3F0|nr:tRNA pseudouridine(55) synthase TruB [Lolliginicoccus levis]
MAERNGGHVLGGLVVVDKPSGMTSHDVVGRARRILGTRRVGHAGTLDPMATGVLVLGVGRTTKLLGHLSLATKEYHATIRLGQATTTDDAEGDVISEAPASHLTEVDYAPVIASLTGRIEQVPSSVSAIKVDGKRAYDRVRSGEDVTLPSRAVTITRFEVVEARQAGELLDIDVEVECSSGTYIRALARDLGSALGVGGHLTRLRRTQVGPFSLDDARTLEQLAEQPAMSLTLDEAISRAFPVRQVSEGEARELRHGKWLEPTGEFAGVHGAVDAEGTAWALLEEKGRRASPVFVARPVGVVD